MTVSDWHRNENRAWTKKKRKEVASKGGQATLKKYGKEYFSALGSKGGTKVSQDREHMAKIGRIGGSR